MEKNKIILLALYSIGFLFAVLAILLTSFYTKIQITSDIINTFLTLDALLLGSSLIAFQFITTKSEIIKELRKEFLDSGILSILSIIFGIIYIPAQQYVLVGLISIFFFTWGLSILFATIVFIRFGIYTSSYKAYKNRK